MTLESMTDLSQSRLKFIREHFLYKLLCHEFVNPTIKISLFTGMSRLFFKRYMQVRECDVTHSHVRDMTHSQEGRDSMHTLVNNESHVPCAHLYTCDMTHPREGHVSFTRRTWLNAHHGTQRVALAMCAPSYVCHDSLIETWLIRMMDMTHSQEGHDSMHTLAN